MLIDTAGRQTPDMTGLNRVIGMGKPRIYKMAEEVWVIEYQHGKGADIKVCPSWQDCVRELNSIVRFYKARYGRYGL